MLTHLDLFILRDDSLLFVEEADSVSSLLILAEDLLCQLFVVRTLVIVFLNDEMISELLLHGKGLSPLLQGRPLRQVYIL